MRRREFIAGLGTAAAWPVAARAQQPDRMRRIGMLWPYTEGDPEANAWLATFQEELEKLGWVEGRNVRSIIGGRPLTKSRCSDSPGNSSCCSPI